MKIVFDSALDSRSWPTVLGDRQAAVGEIRVGCLGLLSSLETMLGLRGPGLAEGVRIASLVPVIQQTEGFWSTSTDVDPFGVARELIRLQDYLVMHGWQGQGVTGRLDDLAKLVDSVLPGIPQRLLAVANSLTEYSGPLPDLFLVESVDNLPLLWQQLFLGLAAKGAACQDITTSQPEASGDLQAAKGEQFSPVNDGSLQLIRSVGMLDAAENIVAWLATVAEEDGLAETVIIGSDSVLDEALHRFGLPVTGAESQHGSALLQLLPLVLSCGWSPADPAAIMELLTMPASPVPPGISRRLIKALEKWPALASPLWQENMAEGLAAIEDSEKRQQVATRIEIIFSPVAQDSFPVQEIERRVDVLLKWLHGRFQGDEVAYPAISQCKIFKEMVIASGQESFREPFLKKILDEASSSVSSQPQLRAQAGLAAISTPEAITGLAKRVIWWNFSRSSVPSLSLPLLSSAEQTALAGAGVVLPDSALLTTNQAKRWRRPLYFASEQLILVCPEQDSSGEDLHPHPLWDELLAASDNKAEELVRANIKHGLIIAKKNPESLPLPESQEEWQAIPGSITPRDKESPSSLENFLGCPLNWCFNYQALIRRGHWATLPDMVPTLGSLAHELLEEVIAQQPLPSPDEGATMAGKLFAKKAPQLVAPLFQEGQEGELEKIRNTVVLATKSLLSHFRDAGVKELVIEEHLEGKFADQNLQGWADVVVKKPFTVIDLKRSFSGFFKKKMTSGTALQIVIYGWLLKEAHGVFPELAYFTLEDQTFLTTDSNHFVNGDDVQAPATEDVWQIFAKTYKEAWKLLAKGVVLCPGNSDEDIKAELTEDQLIMQPPCRFCDYDVLCGRRFS